MGRMLWSGRGSGPKRLASGFVGFSRANAGSYHERMEAHRSRWVLVAAAVVVVLAVVALICLFSSASGPRFS